MKIAAAILVLILAVGVAAEAEAAKKKSSSSMTSAQRKKRFDEALKWCRKQYGAQMVYVRFENYYGTYTPVCYHY